MELWITAIAWVTYYFLHSLLLSDKVKAGLIKSLGLSATTYRLLYTLFSTAGLVLLISCYLSGERESLADTSSEWMRFAGGLLMGLSVWMMFRAFKVYNLKVFIGLKEEDSKPKLHTEGMNELVRHPLYLGIFVFLMGALLLEATYTFGIIFLASVLYLYVGAWLEEKKLVKQFGKKYKKYQEEVPMLIPGLF